MSTSDIAVIGLSGLFPGANNLDEIYYNLSNGIDSVKELSVDRKKITSIDQYKDYQIGGYLDRIDEFDYPFFNLSRNEALNMDPHQRILLQLVSCAIENAGYSLREFKGSRTAVIIGAPGAPKPSYYQLISEFDPTAVPGNLHSVISGRISNFFDLHGPAMVIDTACSSSLLAIHEGCNKILADEADIAIVGGINLNFDFSLKEPGDEILGVESPDGKCKTFDAAANGIVGGEGGGIAILKPLEQALKDGDIIHAVIKGGAVNQDGGRSTGITAPSSVAQTEVITKAWGRAGINPESISYIECHGTGTHIGDPIEIKGLTDAFNSYSNKRKFCAISSLKTNIGHLAGAAGIASFIKVILSLKYKKLFPSLHFNTPNPHINFEDTAIYVNTKLKDWNVEEGVRRAGVSAFGLSGTNVHIVLEEGPIQNTNDVSATEQNCLVTLSAKSSNSLKRYSASLIEYLKKDTPGFENITYVLNHGRDDHLYRYAVTAANKEELIQVLERDFDNGQEIAMSKELNIVFLFSHDIDIKRNQIEYLVNQYPVFNKTYTECFELAGKQADNQNVSKLIFQFSLYQLWRSFGISSKKIIGYGVGNIVAKIISKKISLSEGIKEAIDLTLEPLDVNKLRVIVSKLSETGHLLYLEMGAHGVLSEKIESFTNQINNLCIFSSFVPDKSFSLMETLSAMYMKGLKINWDSYYKSIKNQRVEVPTYSFEKISCWVEAPNTFKRHDSQEKAPDNKSVTCRVTGLNVTSTEETLAQIWAEVLKLDEIDVEDDFFDLGGSSLNGLRLIGRIDRVFNVEINFEDVYEYPTIKELSTYIDSLECAKSDEVNESEIKSNTLEIFPINNNEQMPLSFAQQSLWFLDQLEEGESSLYNVPLAIQFRGVLNQEALNKSLVEVVKRHEVLRSTFPVVDGKPFVKIEKAKDSILNVTDLKHYSLKEHKTEISKWIDEESKRPFDLVKGPILRSNLLILDNNEYVLLVTMHHIVSDGWSIQILISELVSFYNAFVEDKYPVLESLPIQYYDYANWQQNYLQGKQLEKLLDYWRNKHHEAPLLLKLPLDYDRPTIQNFQGASYSFQLGVELTEKLKKLSHNEGATLFMILLAAWKTLLYRYSGQEDIVVGSPVAGRQLEIEGLIGLFINTLALRSDLSGNPTFRSFLQRVRKTTLEAFSHQQLPFSKLLDTLKIPRTSSYSPLVQVMFDYHNHKSLSREEKPVGMDMEFISSVTEKAKFDLCMTLAEGDNEIIGILEYSSVLFKQSTIELLMERFFKLIESIVDYPETQLLDIEIERQKVPTFIKEQIANDELIDFDF
ncbi:hypothetical protein GCM10008014_15490 [Paenibacillus silvae]|uniref:Carrier domain-containing protein n=1 Tax=Paenibacillus silvae TaxID=1325358 RepID=A0ABQ1Z741_9BACL|nr:condensation domain-containing protein [Paenibacillus silvae]GGH50401.1 hypothetical protein GCM10008014_15490 [Paenibacillus silvae]